MLSNAPSVGLDPDWETTPFHFAQLLAPKLSVSGSRAGLHLHLARLPAARAAGAGALHATPATACVGATSPYLYAFGFGGGIGEGTLIGRVAHRARTARSRVNVIDNHTPGAEGYLPPGGILSPAEPLEDDSTYTAQVTFTSDDGRPGDAALDASAPASSARRPSSRSARPTRTARAPPRRCRAAARRG